MHFIFETANFTLKIFKRICSYGSSTVSSSTVARKVLIKCVEKSSSIKFHQNLKFVPHACN